MWQAIKPKQPDSPKDGYTALEAHKLTENFCRVKYATQQASAAKAWQNLLSSGHKVGEFLTSLETITVYSRTAFEWSQSR